MNLNGWALGGMLCIVYMLVVGGLALNKSPGLVKLVRMKMGKNTTDKAAITLSLVMAVVMGVVGIVLFMIGAGKL